MPLSMVDRIGRMKILFAMILAVMAVQGADFGAKECGVAVLGFDEL